MSWQIIRDAGAGAGQSVGWSIFRNASGPSGPAAAMDLGMGFSNGYAAGEVIPGPAALHPTPVTQGRFRSLSGAAVAQTFGVEQFSPAGVTEIGTAVMDPATQGGGPLFLGTVTITAPGVTFAPGDVPALVCPLGGEDVQLRDAELTLGGP